MLNQISLAKSKSKNSEAFGLVFMSQTANLFEDSFHEYVIVNLWLNTSDY